MNLQGNVYTRNPENKIKPLFCENWLGKLPATEGKISAPWEESTLGRIIRRMEYGHFLIIYEISDLGGNLTEGIEILSAVFELGAILYIVSENVFLAAESYTSIPGFPVGRRMAVIELCLQLADMDRRRRSDLTKAGLKRKQAKGKKLGRPKGASNSKLDADRDEIIRLLKLGCTQNYLAREYGVAPSTMNVWVNKNVRKK